MTHTITLQKDGNRISFTMVKGVRSVILKNSAGDDGRITREEALDRMEALIADGWTVSRSWR